MDGGGDPELNGGGAGAPDLEGEDDLDGLVDTEERVSEAMQTAQAQLDIPLETLPSDIQNEKAISDFMLADVHAKRVVVGNSAAQSSHRSTYCQLGCLLWSLPGVGPGDLGAVACFHQQ